MYLASILVRLVLSEALKLGWKESGMLTINFKDSVDFDASHCESMVVFDAVIFLLFTLIVHISVNFFQIRRAISI